MTPWSQVRDINFLEAARSALVGYTQWEVNNPLRYVGMSSSHTRNQSLSGINVIFWFHVGSKFCEMKTNLFLKVILQIHFNLCQLLEALSRAGPSTKHLK